MRLSTKQSRIESQNSQFEYLIKGGYKHEVYKGLNIFTHDEAGRFTLKVFQDTSSNHTKYVWYRTEESRAKAIDESKASYDSWKKWKEEQKEKNKGKLTGAAACAAAIREDLKNMFPGVKFSVRGETFSMGDAVRISWTDGPTVKQVDVLEGKYKDGYFDGMQDMYVYTHKGDGPSAKYITTSREISKEINEVSTPLAEKYFADGWALDCRDAQNWLYQLLYNSPIPLGATVTGIKRTDKESGSHDVSSWFSLEFANEETTQPETKKETHTEPQTTAAVDVSVIDYSEKAIAVTGDTKPIKEKLKELGGKFNARLTCGPGWIFSKKRLPEVVKFLTEYAQTSAPVEIVQEANEPETQTEQNIDFWLLGVENTDTGKAYFLHNRTIIFVSDKNATKEGEILLCQIEADSYRIATPDEMSIIECQFDLSKLDTHTETPQMLALMPGIAPASPSLHSPLTIIQ